VRPKFWTIPLVLSIAAVVWCSARVRVPALELPERLPVGTPADMEAPGDVWLIEARASARRVVARELLAGRLTVSEAAAVFGWLDRQHPPLPSSMIEAADRAMASGSPVGSKLAASAQHDGEWLCLRTAGYARNLASAESPDRADCLSVALDASLLRAWQTGEARSLSPINEDDCRALLLRARERSIAEVSDLRLIDRKGK